MKLKPGILKSILCIINCGVIVTYLLACLVPFINTAKFWYIAFLGLAFPILLFILVLFVIFWLLVKSKWWKVSAITLLLGFQQIGALIAFNIPSTFNETKAAGTFRILQWNVTCWDQYDPQGRANDVDSRLQMIDLIKKQDADILCFQEFFESNDTTKYVSNIATIENAGYPYHYYLRSGLLDNHFYMGIAIFSKYPIIDSAKFLFDPKANAENLIYADIKIHDKIIRVFTTHLQSVSFKKNDYKSLRQIKRGKEEGIKDSKTIVSKLKSGYVHRYQQAKLVRSRMEQSPYPAIICGDFNDVPNSSTYFNLRGGLQDTFLEKGFFIGRTYRYIFPTLRIDYILAGKKFNVNQFRVIHVPYLDHHPIEADLKLP